MTSQSMAVRASLLLFSLVDAHSRSSSFSLRRHATVKGDPLANSRDGGEGNVDPSNRMDVSDHYPWHDKHPEEHNMENPNDPGGSSGATTTTTSTENPTTTTKPSSLETTTEATPVETTTTTTEATQLETTTTRATPSENKDSRVVCQSDDEGNFGYIETNQDIEGETSDEVTYYYEVETLPGANLTEIIPEIEVAINDLLLPVLFEDTCKPQVTLRKRRRMDTVGLSSKPPDKIMLFESCESEMVDETALISSCDVLEGGLTVFFDGEEILGSAEGRILETLEAIMSDGQLDDVHEGIVRVSFREDDANEFVDNPGNREIIPNPNDPAGRGLSPVGYVLVASSAVVVIISVILYLRRQHDREKDDSDEVACDVDDVDKSKEGAMNFDSESKRVLETEKSRVAINSSQSSVSSATDLSTVMDSVTASFDESSPTSSNRSPFAPPVSPLLPKMKDPDEHSLDGIDLFGEA